MTLALIFLGMAASLSANAPSDDAIAAIRLFNPTGYVGQSLVEVPVGRIATPGIIDWTSHRLVRGDEAIPFAIREGRAHWRAELTAPVASPRAEDLVVFWCAVPPGEWVTVDIVPGTPDQTSAMTREKGAVTVRYPGVEAVVDEASGMLMALSLQGVSVLEGPMVMKAWPLPPDAFQYTGNIGPGYVPFQVAVKEGDPEPVTARLVSSSSTPAMTELNVVLEIDGGPALALTYRIHGGGLVEIVADERPWEGESPWMTHGVSFALPLKGEARNLPLLDNRQPFYGFKDFAGTVPQFAQMYSGEAVDVVVTGDEIVNGRHWQRRIQAAPKDSGNSLLESMDEGLIVDLVPVAFRRLETTFAIVNDEQTRPAQEMGSCALGAIGIQSETTDDPSRANSIRFSPIDDADGIHGDGYAIREETDSRVVVTANTRLGLHQAATDIAASLRQNKHLPLIAGNPVVDIRGGGFGGGAFEVDFPYGDDAEWEHVFDNLLDSGMNTFWCLGMWGNWKMPVSYAAMPELRSDDPKAYDESSGVLFSELDQHREHGLKLMHYLQERGGRVFVWLPIGCVPTTFMEQYPEAIAPGKVGEFWGRPKGTPCFTHPIYQRYLDAFLQELIDTYPLDGVVLVRDDNGGVCDCERCTAFTDASVTKNAVWEQYIQIHGWLRGHDFKGAIGVYPYFDGYTPALDAQVPDDLFIAGHGASTAILTRDQAQIGHMPDTWLDSLYTNFKLPSSPRVRRLLNDRNSFWIGGAYRTTELPWEAIGYFGWEPTATANTFRYQWGAREFGKEIALAFVAMNDVYEELWEINARFMIPNVWVKLEAAERARITTEALGLMETYSARLAALRESAPNYDAVWYDNAALYRHFFEYHLRRLGLFMEMQEIAHQYAVEIEGPDGLSEEPRTTLLETWDEMKRWAAKYRDALHEIPGDMLKATRDMTMPYDEWMSGFEGWLDPQLERHQFAATVSAAVPELYAGERFSITVEVKNTGVIPWDVCRLGVSDEGNDLGMALEPHPDGQTIAPGDTVTLIMSGTAPETSGEVELILTAYSPTRNRMKIGEATAKLSWK